MIWALLGALTLSVVAALIWPLIRDGHRDTQEPRDIAVLKDQLAEVDRDLSRGTMSETEAEVIKLEIQRRLLAAARRPTAPPWREGPGLRAGLTAAVAVIVPIVAFVIYMNLGSPLLRPAQVAQQTDQDMVGLVQQLAARMQADPNNIEGWELLARSYRQIDRFGDALEAYRHVLTLNPEGAEPYANFGEMAVTVSSGRVTPEAREAFTTAVKRERGEIRSRFYLGLAAAQDGDAQRAIAIWRDLTAGAPPDASWLEMVRGQMFQVAQSAAIMPMNVEPRHPLDATPSSPTPAAPKAVEAPPSTPGDVTSPDVSAIKGQFSGENLAQIQAMVGALAGRLENNPEDYNGWLMLGRSYIVLQNTSGAKGAFEKAMALKPREIEPKLNYLGALVSETDLNNSAPLPPALIKISLEILQLSPEQPEALFVQGLSAFKAGDAAAARKDWTTARSKAQGALATDLDRRLKALN